MEKDNNQERTVQSAMDNIIKLSHTENERSYGLDEYYGKGLRVDVFAS